MGCKPKKALELLVLFLLLLSLSACTAMEIVPLPVADDYDVVASATPSGKLKVGLVPGLYSKMFTDIIQPALEDMGYSIEIVHYNNYSSPNIALTRNEIDLNMFQSYKYLNNYKFNNDAALSAIVEVPTAPTGIFSSAYRSLQEIEYGATVAISSESNDLSRSLVVLENAGLIILDPLKSKEKATIDDIIANPSGLIISLLQPENLVQAVGFYQLAVIDGVHATNDNLKKSNALYKETINDDYLVVIAVRAKDLHAQFINDIISIINSDEYKAAIINPDGAFVNFQLPSSFLE